VRADVCAARDEHSNETHIAGFRREVERRVSQPHWDVDMNCGVSEKVSGAVDEAG
jgi:hypothetical protein